MRAQKDERKVESGWESLHFREYPSNPQQNVGRNMDNKGHLIEISDENEEHVMGSWRKDDPVTKVANDLSDCLCLLMFCGS